MKIRLFKPKPGQKRGFGPVWGKQIKVFVFDFYFFGIQISFGKTPFDAIAQADKAQKMFNNKCLVCQNPLIISASKQIANYHRECRRFRHHPERYAQLAKK